MIVSGVQAHLHRAPSLHLPLPPRTYVWAAASWERMCPSKPECPWRGNRQTSSGSHSQNADIRGSLRFTQKNGGRRKSWRPHNPPALTPSSAQQETNPEGTLQARGGPRAPPGSHRDGEPGGRVQTLKSPSASTLTLIQFFRTLIPGFRNQIPTARSKDPGARSPVLVPHQVSTYNSNSREASGLSFFSSGG